MSSAEPLAVEPTQEATPEPVSPHEKPTVETCPRARIVPGAGLVIDTVGFVLSMLTGIAVDAVFPALSAHVPVTRWPVPSDETNAFAGGLPGAKPDVASEQVNTTVTSVLFQPLLFGVGAVVAEIMGAVASTLTVTVRELVPPPEVALQVSEVLVHARGSCECVVWGCVGCVAGRVGC